MGESLRQYCTLGKAPKMPQPEGGSHPWTTVKWRKWREGRPGTSRTMGGIMGGYFGIDHLGVQSRLQCRITSPIIASVAHQKFQNCPAWISSSLRHYSNKALCEQAHCNATPRRKTQGPGGTLHLSPFFTANKKASRMLIEIDDIRSPACWMEKGKAAKAKGR